MKISVWSSSEEWLSQQKKGAGNRWGINSGWEVLLFLHISSEEKLSPQWSQPSILSPTYLFSKGFVHSLPYHWHNPESDVIHANLQAEGPFLKAAIAERLFFPSVFLHPNPVPELCQASSEHLRTVVNNKEWKFLSWHFSSENPGRQLVAHSNKTTKKTF